MVCAATLANDLHMDLSLPWRWMMASSYLCKERTELCATAPCACVSVHFMNGGCGGGLGVNTKLTTLVRTKEPAAAKMPVVALRG